MACSSLILKGLEGTNCDGSKGGIIRAYVANASDVSGFTIATAATASSGVSTNESVTAINMETSKYFYEYDLKRGVGSMTSTLNVDSANGVSFVQTDVVLQFAKMETKKRMEMAAFSLNDLVVVVIDSNNKGWVLGVEEPVSASAGSGQTGQARTDGNFYQITLQSTDETFPMELLPGSTYKNADEYMQTLIDA